MEAPPGEAPDPGDDRTDGPALDVDAPDGAGTGLAEALPAWARGPEGSEAADHGGVRELGDANAPAEQWEAFGVHDDAVEGWKVLGFGPFAAALAQGDGYGPESARHAAKQLQRLARSWRHVGLASAEGLRWHRAGFEAREAARCQDQGIPVDRALSSGQGHRLVG